MKWNIWQFSLKKIAPNAEIFPQKKKKKKKNSPAPSPSHNVSSLKSWSFEFEEYSDFFNPLPKKNEDQVGTGWYVMQLSGKQMQCTIVAQLLWC